ncbi:MAG: dipeptidase PepE [Chitinophagaceae bacterium]
MPSPRILAISSSRVGNSGYLETASPLIQHFLVEESLAIAFIPFASVDKNYEASLLSVREGLSVLNFSIHLVEPHNAITVIEKADVIMVGGGNTFKLLHDIYDLRLMDIIRNKVTAGTPYIGWSAGSNIAGATICTTNDMPVIEPESFKAFCFFPFQINPHYVNIKMEGHHGETRDQRLMEFTILNPGVPVVGLPEGTALLLENEVLRFIGDAGGVLFNSDENTGQPVRKEIKREADLSFLLK